MNADEGRRPGFAFDRDSGILSIIVAIIYQAAPLAKRIRGATCLAAMSNHVYVNFVETVFGQKASHDFMGFLVGAFFGNEREAAGYAKDVSVYGKDRAVA